MQVRCPNCAEPVPSQHINIQQMAAVCPACDAVFQFEIPTAAKLKRRKAKQPPKMLLRESETGLHMNFRTNFHLQSSETFLASLIIGLTFGFVTLLMLAKIYSGDDLSLLLPAGFGLTSLVMFYFAALAAFNKTHIDVRENDIQVSRKPLPSPFEQTQQLSLDGVTGLRPEETPFSVKEGYDIPRFRIWAEMADGSRKLLLNDVIEDYALYISQVLSDYLQLDPETSARRLEEDYPAEIADGPSEEALADTGQGTH